MHFSGYHFELLFAVITITFIKHFINFRLLNFEIYFTNLMFGFTIKKRQGFFHFSFIIPSLLTQSLCEELIGKVKKRADG